MFIISLELITIFPSKTTGKDIRKLNFRASVSSNFLKSKVETVIPDLESPGRVESP